MTLALHRLFEAPCSLSYRGMHGGHLSQSKQLFMVLSPRCPHTQMTSVCTVVSKKSVLYFMITVATDPFVVLGCTLNLLSHQLSVPWGHLGTELLGSCVPQPLPIVAALIISMSTKMDHCCKLQLGSL